MESSQVVSNSFHLFLSLEENKDHENDVNGIFVTISLQPHLNLPSLAVVNNNNDINDNNNYHYNGHFDDNNNNNNKTNDDDNEDDMGNSKILITEVHYIYFINNY